MVARKGELAVQGEDALSSIEPQSKKITKGRVQQQITPVPSTFAVVIESLEVAFDEDLRLAIFQRLLREQQQIAQLATEEEKLSKVLEFAKLEALEKGREKGKQSAREEIAKQKKEQLAAIQKRFINVELEQLIGTCDYLPYPAMKQTVDAFAARVKVKLEWKELDDGQFECIPSIA
jgi:hypothetical protein